MQRVRGRLAVAPASALRLEPEIGGTTPSLQAADAGTQPLDHLPGAGIETASPAASPPVVRPEKTAGHDKAAVQQAAAGPGVAQRLENPSVSPSPDAGLPGNGSGSGSATARPSHRRVRPCRWQRSSPARPLRRPAQAAGMRRASALGLTQLPSCVKRRRSRTAPVQPAQMGQPENLPTLPVSPVISIMPEDYAGAAR